MLTSFRGSMMLLVGLLACAWGLSFCVDTSSLIPPHTRYKHVVTELSSHSSPMDVIATVNVRLGVRLLPEDVITWETLKAQGHPAEEALYIVVSYRQAQRILP